MTISTSNEKIYAKKYYQQYFQNKCILDCLYFVLK